MTTHKGTQLKNGDILELRTNPGASPKYFLNDKEIDMIDYWYYLQDDQYEKTKEILEANRKTAWTLLRKFFRIQKS